MEFYSCGNQNDVSGFFQKKIKIEFLTTILNYLSHSASQILGSNLLLLLCRFIET